MQNNNKNNNSSKPDTSGDERSDVLFSANLSFLPFLYLSFKEFFLQTYKTYDFVLRQNDHDD